jgi:ribonuclease E
MLFSSFSLSREKSGATKKMLINVVDPEESRIAIIENGKLLDLTIEISGREKQRGNIYKGVVQKIVPSFRAAFVDYCGTRHGFLPLDEVHPDYYSVSAPDRKSVPSPNKILQRGQEVLVQVVKEEKDTKGASLTTYLSLPGRYLVLTPGSNRSGISRKIEDESERNKLKDIARELHLPEGMGVIVRTAGLSKIKKDLQRDAAYLLRLWKAIQEKAKSARPPAVIFQESSTVIQALRDYFTSDIDEVIVDSQEMFKKVRDFFKQVIPKHYRQVKLYEGREPLFSKYGVEAQIESIHERKITLKSGGSIVIDPTEALVAIDVNSARFTQLKDPEETVLITNLEAAEEIGRQLRLRDLGGLIVIDFIDMKSQKNNQQVERHLRNAFKVDKANIELSKISKFGLLEMTREQIRSPLSAMGYSACSACGGRGRIKSTESLSLIILRKIHAQASAGTSSQVHATLYPPVAQYLLNQKRAELCSIEKEFNMKIMITADPETPAEQYQLEFVNKEKVKS